MGHFEKQNFISKGGFEGYVNECKDQLILTYTIYNELKDLPYIGPAINFKPHPKSIISHY